LTIRTTPGAAGAAATTEPCRSSRNPRRAIRNLEELLRAEQGVAFCGNRDTLTRVTALAAPCGVTCGTDRAEDRIVMRMAATIVWQCGTCGSRKTAEPAGGARGRSESASVPRPTPEQAAERAQEGAGAESQAADWSRLRLDRGLRSFRRRR
jgi:ribosomal protein L37AE/L43A